MCVFYFVETSFWGSMIVVSPPSLLAVFECRTEHEECFFKGAKKV